MGKQIRIFLSDGTPSGVRHAEITNWTGQALACPRSRFQELREWQEVKRPGVYFLFGVSEETGEESVYIGESEIVFDRLLHHITGKDFWNELVAFTSKDDNLTKGHVKYLESRFIQLATEASRFGIANTASPVPSALPRADRDAMEEYLGSARILLGVLGHKVLEPYVAPNRQDQQPDVIDDPLKTILPVAIPLHSEKPPSPDNPIFSLHIIGLDAHATRTDEGLVVLSGSEAAVTVQNSLSVGYRVLREKLHQTGVLVPAGTKLQFTRDQLFNSPSQAAAVLTGYSINGRDAWRLNDGTTYAAFEARASVALLRELKDSV